MKNNSHYWVLQWNNLYWQMSVTPLKFLNTSKIIFTTRISSISIGIMCIFPSHCRSSSFYFIFTIDDSSRFFQSVFHCRYSGHNLPGKISKYLISLRISRNGSAVEISLCRHLVIKNISWKFRFFRIFEINFDFSAFQ